MVAAKVGVTLAFADRYGWHRDELYYLACARHLAFGYVDFPPITPLLAAGVNLLAPGSLIALRSIPVAAGAAGLVMAAAIARELGGNPRAQVIAALGLLLSPMYIGGNLLFQTVSFDQLTWTAAILIFVSLLRGRSWRLWLALGVVLGLGLETKFTILALPVVAFASLALTQRWDLLTSRGPWLAMCIALVLFAPNLGWQLTHGWVSVQYALAHRGQTDGPIAYWLQQLLLFGPLMIPPALLGIADLRKDHRFVPLLYMAVGVELIFFVVGGKSYYAGPIYPLLYAAGAIWLEARLISRRRRLLGFGSAAMLTLVLVPIGLPVLPADVMASSGIWKVRKDYADMVGWQELARETAAAYESVPLDQRSGTIILAGNYGEAGAIDLYGPALGLPGAVSPHLTYWYWAPPDMNPSTAIVLGFNEVDLGRYFEECRAVGTITNSEGVRNQEYGGTIFICTHPRRPLWQVWDSLRDLS